MSSLTALAAAAALALGAAVARADPALADRTVGSKVDGALAERDGKLVRPAGDAAATHDKPLDLIATPDGSLLLVKSEDGLDVIDA
jgi:hypothetical protein